MDDSLCDTPAGRDTVVETIIVWCDAPSLCGAPGEDETRKGLYTFDQYDRHVERTFDIVLDTRGVDHVERAGLGILVPWVLRAQSGSVRHPTCACLGAAACPSGGSCVSVEGANVVCICA